MLLVMLGLLTWLGTLEQTEFGLHEVQRKYFESFFLIHRAGPVSIPLPGANLVMCLLFVNLLVGGMLRMRKDKARVGILIVHFGIAFMFVASFVKMYHSEDGHVTLFEGQGANHFESYYRWELSVAEQIGEGRLRERVIPQEGFIDVSAEGPVTLTSSELPFDLIVETFMPNCEPFPKGPMFDVEVPVVDGIFLKSMELDSQAERNIAGAYVTALVKETGERLPGVLWGRDAAPWTVRAGGRDWAVDLRHERYPMPFTLLLDDFTKEDHPRMSMAKSFESDVTVVEGGASRTLTISMNEPLRDGGLVLFQSSWGPSTAGPGDPLFSTFSVVRNPADHYPAWSCFIIAIGLVLHFLRKLVRYVRIEAKAA
jgi:hypothetical protein